MDLKNKYKIKLFLVKLYHEVRIFKNQTKKKSLTINLR